MLPERVYFPKLPLYVRYWYFGPLIATCFFLYSFSGILLSSGLIKAKLEIAAVPVFLAFLGFLSWYIQPLKITLGEYICIHRKKPLSSKCIDYRDIVSIGAGRLKLKKGGYSWRLFVNSSELDDIFDDLIQRKVIHFENLNDLVVREDKAYIFDIVLIIMLHIICFFCLRGECFRSFSFLGSRVVVGSFVYSYFVYCIPIFSLCYF